jgi:hypothetical protein
VVVVGGDNYQIPAGPAPSLLLRLMAENENVNIKETGHFIEQGLTVSSAPGQ